MKKVYFLITIIQYIILIILFLFFIRYKHIYKDAIALSEMAREKLTGHIIDNTSINNSSGLIKLLKQIYNSLPDSIPTANINDVAFGKTFIVNENGFLKIKTGVLRKIIKKTNINNYNYIKTSINSSGFTGGFTNDNGYLDGKNRFIDNKDGTVTDKLTGLMWVKDFNINGKQTWEDGKKFAEECRIGGYTNWRVPEIREIMTLMDFCRYNPALPDNHPFENVKRGYYWTATEYTGGDNYAWFVILLNGSLYSYDKGAEFYLIFCRDL